MLERVARLFMRPRYRVEVCELGCIWVEVARTCTAGAAFAAGVQFAGPHHEYRVRMIAA